MKNEFVEIDEETIAIIIKYKGKKYNCYIDKEDFEIVNSFKTTWCLGVNKTGYVDGVKTKVQKNFKRIQFWLHNVVYHKINSSNVVDHIDHNTLNNKKVNLRELTAQENVQSSRTFGKNTQTTYRNISFEHNKFRVRIRRRSYGCYKTLEEAIQVATEKRKELFPHISEVNNLTIIKQCL